LGVTALFEWKKEVNPMKSGRKKELKLIKFLALLFRLLELCEFPKHSSKYSKRTFDNWQLFALHVLRQKAGKSYDEFVEEWLPCWIPVLKFLKLKQIPSASCLKKFACRLKACWAHSALGKTAKLAGLADVIVGIDGTSSSTKCGSRHYYKRIGMKVRKKDSVKWSSVDDLAKQLIIAIKIRKKARHDNVDFKPLMRRARKETTIKRGIGDRAYDKEGNYELFEDELGGEFIAPVRNKDVPIWRTKGKHRKDMKRYFPKTKYSPRSKKETVISVIKRKMGDALYSVKFHMRKIELLMRVIAYNIDRLLKLGVEA